MIKQKNEQPVALITGGAKRLGAAIAESLAARGFALALHYNKGEREAEALCRRINNEYKAQGARAVPFQADLLHDSPAALADNIAAEFGRPIALLINNASLFRQDNFADCSETLWAEHFRIHLQAPVFLAQAAARIYRAELNRKSKAAAAKPQPSGLIVNMTDQRVLRLNPHFFSYTLSKSALWTATQTMAQALAPHFRVNAIGPGPSLKNAHQDAADFAAQCAGLPMQKGPELGDFGRTILYLWDTPSITGQLIALDGGQHLMWQTPDVALDMRIEND